MEPVEKLHHTIDALFGNGVSKFLPKKIEITYSKKNGRIRSVFHDEKLLCTLRIDGGLAITPLFAQMLLKSKVIAVGRAVLSSEMIQSQNRGVAIKIRDSLKSQNKGDRSL